MSQIISFLNLITRTLRAPFTYLQNFMRNNPATQMGRVLRAQGQQLRFLRSMPRQLANRLLPRRFRTANIGDLRSEGDEDLPDEDKTRAGEFKRASRRRRVQRKAATREAFSQIHLVPQGGGQRTVLHIGSATGESFAEVILYADTDHAVQLRFQLVDENIHGSPLIMRVASAPKESVVTVGNTVAAPEAAIANGDLLDINGHSFKIQLYAFGDLPAVTRVNVAWGTDVGPNRDKNQDAIGIYQHPDAYMFTVADGVGGGYAGEEVSEFSVKYLLSVFKENITYKQFSWYDVYDKAFRYVNAEVRHFVDAAPSVAGSTLTSVFIRNWTAYVAHVGDSRVYHLRGDTFQRVTTDHNRERDVKTRSRAGRSVTVKRSILQKAIGKSDTIQPEIQTLALQPKDMLLLTTDGITNNVSDDELYNILNSKRLSDVPDELIALANSRDNTDNASAIVIDVMREAYDRDVWLANPDERVFVGGPAWYLKLSGPAETDTSYNAVTQLGCLLLVLLVFGSCIFWSGYRVQQFFFGPVHSQELNAGDISGEVNITLTHSATELHTEPPPVITRTPDGNETTGNSTQATISVSPTRPVATAQPATTAPTLPPTQTPATDVATDDAPVRLPIPTSTLRSN